MGGTVKWVFLRKPGAESKKGLEATGRLRSLQCCRHGTRLAWLVRWEREREKEGTRGMDAAVRGRSRRDLDVSTAIE